ncbi:MAG TPA: hypothetical protein VF624_13085 [Tepidisphaeraceae bacterium]|jgi:hypothetical protein
MSSGFCFAPVNASNAIATPHTSGAPATDYRSSRNCRCRGAGFVVVAEAPGAGEFVEGSGVGMAGQVAEQQWIERRAGSDGMATIAVAQAMAFPA